MPEYIEACKKAKEEGWLEWKPEWGDIAIHKGDIGQVTGHEPLHRVRLQFRDIVLEKEWFDISNCTWLPTAGDLLTILRQAGCSVHFTEKSLITSRLISSLYDLRKEDYLASKYVLINNDVSLALLKAVKAVRIKQVKDSAWSSYD